MIYSHNMCECAFLSAACSLPSGPVRVQSSQKRQCSSLDAAEHPLKLQNVGFSTLTLSFFFNDFTFSDKTFQEWHCFAAAELKVFESTTFLLTAAYPNQKHTGFVSSTDMHSIHKHANFPTDTVRIKPWWYKTPVVTTATLSHTNRAFNVLIPAH